MRVALYGATGRAGSRILKELVARGHHVVALTREPQSASEDANVEWRVDDLSDEAHIARAIQGADAVISAYAPPQDNTDALVMVCQRLAQAVQQSHIPRLLVVGGAGSLEVAPGVTLLQSGMLPPEWVPIAASHSKALDALKATSINWTYVAPAAMFEPGKRTGTYRTDRTKLLTDARGESRISMEDYAIAMVDELERPSHPRERFAVAW
ncbi:MAG TPA: NAD(P)-dependent oxidoreductase [Acidobacteriaceae bacterium]|nr:NAD(P)-dependent oxidoreductase [Acidobacteriaceae bacterium]